METKISAKIQIDKHPQVNGSMWPPAYDVVYTLEKWVNGCSTYHKQIVFACRDRVNAEQLKNQLEKTASIEIN